MKPFFEVFRFGLVSGSRPSTRARLLRLPNPVPPFVTLHLQGANRDEVRRAAMQFLANEFEPEAARLTVASRPVLPLHDEVDALTFVTDDAVELALLATLGMTSRDVAAHRDFVELRNRLSAGIIALKFNAEMYPGLFLDYVELYNLSQLLRDDSQPSNGNISGRALLRRPIALPPQLFPHLPAGGARARRCGSRERPR